MKLVAVDQRIDKKCERSLKNIGFGIVKMPPFPLLQEPVSAHPDMLFFAGKGNLVCHRDYFAIAKSEIIDIAETSGLSLVLSDEDMSSEYPRDVIFNAAAIGDKLICRRNSVSKRVAELYPEDKIINVKQGYSKCSVCSVGDNAVITADLSIARAAEKSGIEVLLISGGGVRLDGYDCGFIGGASGTDGERVYFCGNIDLHPDGERIKEFCRIQGREAVSLSDEPLYDYGTLIFI